MSRNKSNLMDDSLTAIKQMSSATTVVRAYAGSDASNALLAMLDALIDSYKLDLMHVKPDGLDRLQAAIQQTVAIRAVVADDTADPPKI